MKQNEIEVVLNKNMLIVGIAVAGLAFVSTPAVVKSAKKAYEDIKKTWPRMSIVEKGLALFLLSGLIVPYFPLALVLFLRIKA